VWIAVVSSGCAAPQPPSDEPASAATIPAKTAEIASVVVDAAPPEAESPLDASAADAPVEAAAAEIDWKNLQKPEMESEELTARAQRLFDAIVANDPTLGEDFWFPKEPFIPLKDVKGPDKYWDNLHTAFQNDVRALHRKRKSWEGAAFKSFEVGSTPKWVKPGDEVNKIGYYRSFHGKLRYEQGGSTFTIDVHTLITWQGRWYTTHLSKFKK